MKKRKEQWAETRQRFFDQQGGRCRICGRELELKDAQLDHSHETGLARGVLCTRCNVNLAAVERNRPYVDWWATHRQQAEDYLAAEPENPVYHRPIGKTEVIKFRAKVLEKDQWFAAAAAAGKDFSDWAREVLDVASGVKIVDLMQALKDSLAKRGQAGGLSAPPTTGEDAVDESRRSTASPADLVVVPWKLRTGDMIDLLTPAQLAGLPKGTRVVRIDGMTAIVGVDEIDGDTRQGRLAYGIPQKPKDGTA